jgi:3-oxoacyl-[acyl-carrier protein] reductase
VDRELDNSIAVVAGGSEGVGLAAAGSLAAEGARVAVLGRNRSALDEAVGFLLALGAPDAIGVSTDLTTLEQVDGASRCVQERWGGWTHNCVRGTVTSPVPT